jgi:hypothetical protein
VPLDSVRCTTGQCPVHQGASTQTLHLRISQAQLRYNSPDCPVWHRTVRCGTGLSGAPAEQRLSARNGRLCKVNSTATEVRAAVRGAPDCPVPHEGKASNGRPASRPNGRMTWRHTGQCPVAHRTMSGGAPDCLVHPSPAHFTNDKILVGGYKYHPNRPLQGVGAQATFQVI